VADLDSLTDVGGWDFIEGAFSARGGSDLVGEADGGIIIDHPFMSDEEDLIEFFSGESSDRHPAHGSLIAVDGPFLDAGVKFMVIVLLEPEREGLVEFFQGQTFPNRGEETFSYRAEESLMVSLPLTI